MAGRNYSELTAKGSQPACVLIANHNVYFNEDRHNRAHDVGFRILLSNIVPGYLDQSVAKIHSGISSVLRPLNSR